MCGKREREKVKERRERERETDTERVVIKLLATLFNYIRE